MTSCCGESLPEKFEAARGFYVICRDKRRRPGETFQGFQQAVGKLPMTGNQSRFCRKLVLRHGVRSVIKEAWRDHSRKKKYIA
jgi:hypothetical protein